MGFIDHATTMSPVIRILVMPGPFKNRSVIAWPQQNPCIEALFLTSFNIMFVVAAAFTECWSQKRRVRSCPLWLTPLCGRWWYSTVAPMPRMQVHTGAAFNMRRLNAELSTKAISDENLLRKVRAPQMADQLGKSMQGWLQKGLEIVLAGHPIDRSAS